MGRNLSTLALDKCLCRGLTHATFHSVEKVSGFSNRVNEIREHISKHSWNKLQRWAGKSGWQNMPMILFALSQSGSNEVKWNF